MAKTVKRTPEELDQAEREWLRAQGEVQRVSNGSHAKFVARMRDVLAEALQESRESLMPGRILR